eukprot:gnl/Dysnectes_brevis/2129_a2474_1371.p1 GENE.gnl/Dysnectes_brevis/2129_a2474_1371~~gnl/Dysnectes_brevis/2129_a2474_1371.p1  ORF type:complete len:534 (-),score=145.86 gnl/Dysnectes_brevis/2129_a2474_1371:46-1647(-)
MSQQALPTSDVEISLSVRDLPKLDLLSESDPFCVLFANTNTGAKAEVGRTEMKKNQDAAEFDTRFTVPYFFEVHQSFTVAVFDADSSTITGDLSRHDKIGEATFSLAELVVSRGSKMEMNLQRGTKSGKVTVIGEHKLKSNLLFEMQFAAKKLPKMDLFGKCDGYLKIYRTRESGNPVLVAQTEVVPKDYNPVWQALRVPFSDLALSDEGTLLRIECYDHDAVGQHDKVGSLDTTVGQLREVARTKGEMLLIHPKKEAVARRKGKAYPGEGRVRLVTFREIRLPSFTDFLQAGTQINLMTSIDFTGSNGNPAVPASLHYQGDPHRPSQYELAIRAVGSVLAPYDSDGIIPAFGFGGRTAQGTSHCFPLDPSVPELPGVEAVIAAYKNALYHVGLSGPTFFAPSIRRASEIARGMTRGSGYVCLLLLTDGVLCDMRDTVDAIVEASKLPVSIVIVGVGSADFSEMEKLDGDVEPLVSTTGEKPLRDIVQFVPFSAFISNPSLLASETLKELPGQVLQYMALHKITPTEVPVIRQ